MKRVIPWAVATVHATLFIAMLASKEPQPYPGPKTDDGFSFSGWHMSTSIMVAARDLHHDDLAMALFLADFPVVILVGLLSLLFDRSMSPVVASYVLAWAWLILGSLWWFAVAKLALRSRPRKALKLVNESLSTGTATNASWKHLPAPLEREDLAFEALFTEAEAVAIRRGLVPEAMEDKWFIYFADGWLNFHRSWTGALIYALRLDDTPSGTTVSESWVNRCASQYAGTDTAYDRQLVRFLIDALLLKKKDVSFPMPSGTDGAAPGVVQHHHVGRAYPEHPSEDDRERSRS
jgi:hypothetical protein